MLFLMGGTNLAAADPTVDRSPPILPNHDLTPGATLPVTEKEVCVPGYAGRVRNVPQFVKNKAYQIYGITSRKPGQYEIDHLISLQLGGSNEISNLWPQSYVTMPWNAHVKDKLENKLHSLVCKGQMTLKEAQDKISGDWIKSYCEVFGANCNGDGAP